jgi:hypothetical protein
MNALAVFVKEEVRYEGVKVEGIADDMRKFMGRAKIKIQGIEEGYDYIMNIISDIFFIV